MTQRQGAPTAAEHARRTRRRPRHTDAGDRRTRRAARLTGAVLVLAAVLPITGCTNDLTEFCTDAASTWCDRCWECASSDEEARRLCSFSEEIDHDACVETLEMVCTSDDHAYHPNLASACSAAIDELSCDDLRREKKPVACRPLL